MTIDQALSGIAILQSAYHNMTKLDEAAANIYSKAIMRYDWSDFVKACDQIIDTSKFFPTVAEIREAVEAITRKRLEEREHDEREKRLLFRGQDAIMDPSSGVHKVIVGPEHQKFLDMLSGKIKLPEPEWTRRTGPAWRPRTVDEDGVVYVPMPYAERAKRVEVLRQQAAELLREQAK